MSSTDWIMTLKTSPVARISRNLFEAQRKEDRKPKKNGVHVSWMRLHLNWWAIENKLVLTEKFKFRKQRYDFCFEEIKVLIDYSATRDADKSNLAQSEGWRVMTYTAMNYRNVINELEKFLV